MEFKVTEAPILKSDVEIGAQIVEMLINDELEHAGTKGMKWGQRLYQNKDGSLTPLGRSRYRKIAKDRAAEKANADIKSGKASFDKNGNAKTKSKTKSTSETEESTKKTKSPEEMTEAELRSEITKLQLRKQLDTLYKEMNPPKESEVKKYAGKFMKEAVVPAATEAGKNLIKNALEEKVGQALGLSKYETKNAKKEINSEYDELLKDLKNEKDALETMKNVYSNREWYKKTFGDKSVDETLKSGLGDSKERTETTSESSTAEKIKSAGEKAGKKAKDKGEEFKKKGDSFKKSAEEMGKDIKKKKKKSKAIVYDENGKRIGKTTFEHSSISESDIALGEEILHSMLSDDELQHYGVLGMKWGVRRGNVSKAYSKAMKKKRKLMDKADKYENQSDDHKIKGSKYHFTKSGKAKGEEHMHEAARLEGKSLKYQRKAEKWQKKIDKAFSDAKLTKVSDKLIEKGKKAVANGKVDKADVLNMKVDEINKFIKERNAKNSRRSASTNTKIPTKNQFGDKSYSSMTNVEKDALEKKYKKRSKELDRQYRNAESVEERKRIKDQRTILTLDYDELFDD